MFMLLMISMLLSINFMFLSHPLSLGLILLMQTTMISVITGNYSLNFWFSYTLFLIMIGGMLILFIYMTSIASNEKFKFNIKTLILSIIPLLLFLPLNYFYMNINTSNKEMTLFNTIPSIYKSMIKFISFPSNLILLFLIMYLLLTLIATVKITNFKYGPLRQKS